MYEDSNRNKINMIGAYLKLYYDINDEKVAKLMTIAKSNIGDVSKYGPSNTFFSKFSFFHIQQSDRKCSRVGHIYILLNDHFAAEWVASVIWPAELDGKCP